MCEGTVRKIAAARGTRRAGFDIVGVFEIEGRQGCPAPRQRRGARGRH
jgi:hypothetical protein